MIQGKYNIPFADYLADPCECPSLSRSTIIDLLDSPARSWWNHPRLNPQPPEPETETKFDIGTAAHDLLLCGGDSIFVVTGFDDWRKKEAQEARKAAREMGKTPLLEKQYEQVCMMSAVANSAIMDCSELGIKDLRVEGDSEVTYIWMENGIWCRIRVDWIRAAKDLILDVKTTATCVNPLIFSGHINKMGYGIQSAFYRRGVKAIEGKEPKFIIMAQETTAPYFCSFHGLDMESEDQAQQKIETAIAKWKECLSTGKWEGYPKRVCYSELRPFDRMEWEIKKVGYGDENETTGKI